jgi:anhydro-N-acetylmuramic acid kinase
VIVAGVMSGTSADGINVALVDVEFDQEERAWPTCKLVGHGEHRYPAAVRRAIFASMNAKSASVADLARLNFLLGELYAEAVIATQRKFKRTVELIGCHGQTLYHQGNSERFLGRNLSVTWQTGEGAVIAARMGIPVVSDFRPADMAAGGKGAPLVPFFDFALYSHKEVGRIVQNIGGIANLTAIPAGASSDDVIAFDTGPGNMVIDGLMERFYKKRFDRDGRTAAKGRVLEPVLAEVLGARFFAHKPPRTAGREEFGREFVAEFLRRCRGARKADIVATATALTARSIAFAIRHFVLAAGIAKAGETPVLPLRTNFAELIVSGGGAKNRTLMRMLEAELSPLPLRLRTSDEFGIPAEAKEAVAFALLAFQTWHHRPSNIPSATGAKRSAILGKISYV